MASSNYGVPDTPLLRGGSSLFSLTFDEFQGVLGESGANLESMNMEELLKNVWTAEESQAMAAAMNSAEGLNGGLASQFSLQKQASLSLPRTLSGKTVEDVWKSLQHQQAGVVPSSMNGQRKVTLGELKLEDFFVKAGLVMKERPAMNQASSNQVLSSHVIPPSNQALHSPNMQNLVPSNQALQSPNMQNLVPSNQVYQVPSVGTSTSSNPMQKATLVQTLAPSNQVQPLIQQNGASNEVFFGFSGNSGFSMAKDGRVEQNGKQQAGSMAFNKTVPTANTLLCPPVTTEWITNPNGRFLQYQNQQGQQQLTQQKASVATTSNFGNVSDGNIGTVLLNGGNGPLLEAAAGRLLPIGGGLGAVVGTGSVGINFGATPGSTRISFGAGSPLSPAFDEDSPGTSNFPLALISEFGNGQQQRRKRCAEAPVEKVIERRQRRMIKNRESAARSRARKQAYTVELEAEVNQLKEENMKLLQKQEEEAARRKKQILAFMPARVIGEEYKGCNLKRTHTGPW